MNRRKNYCPGKVDASCARKIARRSVPSGLEAWEIIKSSNSS